MNSEVQKSLSQRMLSRQAVMVGGVQVGGGAPVVVQSMTNTDTANIAATANQIIELADAGSELVRITVNNDEAAAAIPYIKERLEIPPNITEDEMRELAMSQASVIEVIAGQNIKVVVVKPPKLVNIVLG